MKLKRLLAVLTSVLAIVFCGCSVENYQIPYAFKYYAYKSKTVFGNGITFSAAVRGGDENAALGEMDELLSDINSDMSLTLSSSALSRLNALGNEIDYYEDYESERVEISRNTFELIKKCGEFYKETHGAFNIAVFPLVRLWGVDSNGLAADNHILPNITEVNKVKEYCDMSYINLYEDNGKYFITKTHPKLQIDLGAVAKGYAADKCLEIIVKHGAESGLINISGNICTYGKWYHPDQKKYVRWQLGVVAPRPRNGIAGDMCALSVTGGKTLVTSGDYMRYYIARKDAYKLYVPHIVNSSTGMPLGVEYSEHGYVNTQNHIISATVICSDSAAADAYATALCLMDKSSAVKFLFEKGLHGILVSADNVMSLVGVTESDESGDEYFIYKSGDNAINGYKQYTVEEYKVE